MSNILCFHMPDDGPAEDGPENKWNLLKQKWLFEKLAHLIGKYVPACNSDDNSLLAELIEMSVPLQECTFHMTRQR